MRMARMVIVGCLGLLVAACGSLEPAVGTGPETEPGPEPPTAVPAPWDDPSRVGGNVIRHDQGDVILVEAAAEVDFGSVPVGLVGTRTLTVRNAGDRPVSLESIEISGETFSSATEGAPPVLLPGQEGEVAVSFTPTDERTYEGALVLRDEEGADLLQVALKGWGGGPLLAFDPPALDFGVQPAGRWIGGRTYLGNVGSPGHVGHEETNEFWIRLEGQLDSFQLASGASLDLGTMGIPLYMQFRSSPVGPLLGELVASTGLAAQPEVRFPISVEVVDPEPCTLRPSHEVLDFGTVAADYEGVQLVEVTNAGETACLLWGVHTTRRYDGGSTYFELDEPLDDTFYLEAGATLSLPIRLRATGWWEQELPVDRERFLVIPNGPVEAEPLTIPLRWTLSP